MDKITININMDFKSKLNQIKSRFIKFNIGLTQWDQPNFP